MATRTRPKNRTAVVPLFFVAVFLGLASSIGALCCLDRLETLSAEYPNRDAAQAAIDAGWLPAWLPESATNIREAHDIDTNETFAVFKFSPSEPFYSDCESIAAGKLSLPNGHRHFPAFVDDALETLRASGDLDFYRCPDRFSPRGLAVDSAEGVAYTWFD